MEEFVIIYESAYNEGRLVNNGNNQSTVWQRLVFSSLNMNSESHTFVNQIRLPWYQLLSILREFIPLQKQLGFKFISDESSKMMLKRFTDEQKSSRNAKNTSTLQISEDEVEDKLVSIGFNKRELRKFQKRDIVKLVCLSNGANFSVPGSGKTTVTLAVHLLTAGMNDKLLVICPKAAFTAWNSILVECIDPNFKNTYGDGKFINLSGFNERDINNAFLGEHRYYYTNYEHFVSKKDIFSFIISTKEIHLVLDESHRMKGGLLSQRGASLLSISNLPKRKDILSGTPMPQGVSDLQSQLDFLWPGSSFSQRIEKGEALSSVIAGLYVRTTKDELVLPPVKRNFVRVPMSPAQAVLYGIVRNETLRQLSSFRHGRNVDILGVRKSVIRLLQLASNPILALRGISEEIFIQDNSIVNAIMEDPVSTKMKEACKIVRENSLNKKKTVVWTVFTQNITDLEMLLADLNPVTIYGEIKSGDEAEDSTREGRLRKFHLDNNCWVLIANPAAAGEGISLHSICHDAVYLDRSYISTHYLQSIDRIHRLGLHPGTITNVTILQSASPKGIGSIDYSVSRRLAKKIRAMEELLDDRDLHQIALDEENAEEPVDYTLDLDDVVDLIEELEGKAHYDEAVGI